MKAVIGLLFHPLAHAGLAVAAVIAAIALQQSSAHRADEAGLDGLVAGLLVAGGILLASAAWRHDRNS